MEYLLYFFLGACSFAYVILYRFIKGKNCPPLPPGTMGWPLIGETLELQRLNQSGKPDEFFYRRIRKFNQNIFKTSILGEKTIILCGAAGNKFIFTSEKSLVLTWWPDSLKKLFGTSFFTAPYDEAIRTRRMVMAFLQQEVIHTLVERFDKTCRKCLQRDWIGNSKVKAFSLIKKYAFSLACEMFTSVDDPNWEKRILEEFNILLKGVFQLPIYFPGTRHYKAVQSADFIRKELIQVIERKRIKTDSKERHEKDLISYLIDAQDENGSSLSNIEVADNIILLMDSGHDTSSSTMMMLMKFLAENPHCYEKVLQEQKEIALQKKPGELLNKGDIQKMRYSWNVIREVLRLTPPLGGTFRKAKVDFTYDGYLVPKGWMVSWGVASTHKIAKYFPDPLKFDPMRFDRDTITPHSFVPFGGGPRMCPGKEFARIEMLVFLHNLVCEFEWELEFPDEMISVDPMPISPKGLPVYLYPLK
ncbi:beta-amyrin 28-monooxygenase [Ranunculus cassubicifolius]